MGGHKILHLTIMFCCIIFPIQSLNEEGTILLEFKNSITDPYLNLQNWNPMDSNSCNWTGITCSSNLTGEIPSSIGHLKSLRIIRARRNSLSGPLPVEGVPANTATFQKMDASNFGGNNGLCVVGLNHCHSGPSPSSSARKGSWFKDGSAKEKIVSIVSVGVGVISLGFIVAVWTAITFRQKGSTIRTLWKQREISLKLLETKQSWRPRMTRVKIQEYLVNFI